MIVTGRMVFRARILKAPEKSVRHSLVLTCYDPTKITRIHSVDEAVVEPNDRISVFVEVDDLSEIAVKVHFRI
jgi:hypothetical protein